MKNLISSIYENTVYLIVAVLSLICALPFLDLLFFGSIPENNVPTTAFISVVFVTFSAFFFAVFVYEVITNNK